MEIDGVDDAKDFRDVCKAMTSIGFTSTEQSHVFQTLAAILHLGSIDSTIV